MSIVEKFWQWLIGVKEIESYLPAPVPSKKTEPKPKRHRVARVIGM